MSVVRFRPRPPYSRFLASKIGLKPAHLSRGGIFLFYPRLTASSTVRGHLGVSGGVKPKFAFTQQIFTPSRYFGRGWIALFKYPGQYPPVVNRRTFLIAAFAIAAIFGWLAVNQVLGGWFADQAESASSVRILSLWILRVQAALTVGALLFAAPYVFLTVDVGNTLHAASVRAVAVDFSTFVLVGRSLSPWPVSFQSADQFRPPRPFS